MPGDLATLFVKAGRQAAQDGLFRARRARLSAQPELRTAGRLRPAWPDLDAAFIHQDRPGARAALLVGRGTEVEPAAAPLFLPVERSRKPCGTWNSAI